MGEISSAQAARRGRAAFGLILSAVGWLLVEAEDAADRIACGKAAAPIGLQQQFGFGGVDQFGEAVDGKHHKAIVVAKDQIAGVYGAAAKADGDIDRAKCGSGWAARGDVACVDREVFKAGEGGGVADRPIAEDACGTLGVELATQNVTNHGIGGVACGGNHQDLTGAGLADGVQDCTEIRGDAVDGDGPCAEARLLTCGAQGAECRADLLRGGEIDRDGDGDALPACEQVGGDWGERRIGLGDGHGVSFLVQASRLYDGWPDGYCRTRMPSFSSKAKGLSDFGSGASATSPTETPYCQSGGQIAM